jgi:hypothetical protein
MMDTAVAQRVAEPASDETLVKEIAMDIGKDTVAYAEVMYPEVMTAARSTFKLALRNHIYNEIIAAIKVTGAGEIEARLEDRKRFRRRWTKAYRDMRASPQTGEGTGKPLKEKGADAERRPKFREETPVGRV